MREIKFRAWDKNDKEMFLMNGRSWGCFWDTVDQTYDNDYILMQCTGLYDRNGKEIFEGDIVKQLNNHNGKLDQIAKVSCGETIDDWRWGVYRTISVALTFHKNTEVIGNIWENPELLDTIELGYVDN